MISLHYQCPHCDNAVHINLDTDEAEDDVRIDVRCATRHPRPVRMARVEAPSTPATTTR